MKSSPKTRTTKTNSPVWSTLGRTQLHANHVRSIYLDTIRTHTGAESEYSWVDARSASFVVPVTDDGQIVLVRQYRYPIDRYVYEVPAGAIDAGEDPITAAARELAEEVGGVATDIQSLGMFFSAAAHLKLECHCFLARGVTLGETRQEAIELMTIHTMPPEEAFALARSGVMEGQSALVLLMAEPHLRGH